jgi:ATP-dependent DNA helicase RecQ
LRKSSAASSETGFGTLFHALRQLRMTIANAQGVPPYVVFNDRTLLELVEQMPDSEHAFLEISGIGPVKAQRYSEVFLRCIRTWREEQERPIGG